MESENLTRDHYSVKEEVCNLLERTTDLAELERLKLEDKLQKNKRKCEELEETVIRLIEEKRVSNDREKRDEDKISAEYSKMANEKNKLIFELNEKINELKNKNLENERLVGVYQVKLRCLDINMVKMGQEIDDLRRENFVANITIDEFKERINELKNKNLESERLAGVYLEKCDSLDVKMVKMGQEVEDLRREKFEASKTIDELRLKKSESDMVAEIYKSRLENLSPRIKNIEKNLADMSTMKVGDFANLVNDVRKLATSEEGGELDFLDNAENVVVLSPGVRSTYNSSRSRSSGLSNKGDRNLVRSCTRETDAHTVNASPGSQSGRNIPRAESNESEEPLGSVAHATGTGALMSGAGRFSKIARSSSAAEDIIEILDSDDENEMNFVRSPSSCQRCKQDRTDCMKDLLASSSTKRKIRNTCTSDEDNNVLIHEKENEVLESSHEGIDSQTPLEKFNGLDDEVSTDSDDSCTDSRMIDLVASLGS